MKTLVASLADNKAALGPPLRRVGGVRADAGVRGRRRRDGPGRARPLALDLPRAQAARRRAPTRTASAATSRLALLDDELPDWNAFIAANLLVDGVLTTFVAACVDSSLDADGPAREARSSRRRARTACTARRGRGACAAATERDAFVARLQETWEHAGRWIGPDDDAGVRGRARGRRGLARPGRRSAS